MRYMVEVCTQKIEKLMEMNGLTLITFETFCWWNKLQNIGNVLKGRKEIFVCYNYSKCINVNRYSLQTNQEVGKYMEWIIYIEKSERMEKWFHKHKFGKFVCLFNVVFDLCSCIIVVQNVTGAKQAKFPVGEIC